jgi:hypothetical protein
MSHFTRVQTKIRELPFLEHALRDLSYRYETGSVNVRGYRGIVEPVEVAIRTGSNYDIGFRLEGESYACVADWWGVERYAAIQQQQFLTNVTQRYAYHKTLETLSQQGLQVAHEQVTEENVIELVVRWG